MFSPTAGEKTAGLIEKETLKKSEYRISNHEYRNLLRRTSVEGMYSIYFIKRLSEAIPQIFNLNSSIFNSGLSWLVLTSVSRKKTGHVMAALKLIQGGNLPGADLVTIAAAGMKSAVCRGIDG